MANTYNTTTGFNAVDIVDRSTTIGVGGAIKADGTLDAPGTGDYVDKHHLETEVFHNVNIVNELMGITEYTPLFNLIKSNSISTYLDGGIHTFRWKSPIKIKKGSSIKDCYAVVNKRFAAAKTVHAETPLEIAESLEDCKCPPKDCGGRTDVFFIESVQELRAEAERLIAREIEEELATALTSTTVPAIADAYNKTTRYQQMAGGVAELVNSFLKIGLTLPKNNLVFLANSLAVLDVELEDSRRYQYNYDQKTWNSLINAGVSGFVQGVPVIMVGDDVVDLTTGWILRPLTFLGAAIQCDKERVGYIQKDVAAGTGDIISMEQGYVRKAWVGVADLTNDMLKSIADALNVNSATLNLVGLKGKALKTTTTTNP